VCYAHEDSRVVYPELAWLNEQGLNLWYDEGISAGKNWRAAIGDSLLEASHILFYVSGRSLKSDHCNREINLALDEGKNIVPIYLEDVELTSDLKVGLNRVQALYRDQDPSYQQRLLNALGQSAQSLKPKTNDHVDMEAMRSIAILPFTNMTANEETGYFADGLTEDILDNLSQDPNIMVASRSASFQYSDRGYDPSTIGEKLEVAYLLEGSVRQLGARIRISVRLVRTADGFQVWSRSYERELADEFEMQTTIAASIAYVALGKLNLDIQKSGGWRHDKAFVGVDPIAVRHYINATDEYFNIRLGEGGDFDTFVRFLESAAEADTSFFAPYPYLTTAYYQHHRSGLLSLREASPAAHAAVDRAIVLAPHSFMGRFQLATIHLHLDLDYAQAEAELRTLLKQRPKFGLLHLRLARIALREGRAGEALSQLVNAPQLEAPNEKAIYLGNLAWLLCVVGDYEGALEATAFGLKLVLGSPDREEIIRTHALSLIQMGRTEEAKPFVDEGWALNRRASPENYIALFANIGEIEKAKNISRDLRLGLVNHYALATGYLAIKDLDQTFKSIHAGIENNDQHLLESILLAEWWKPIRDDPRYSEMLNFLDSKVTHTRTYLDNLARKDR
jgi:TolB-like protein/Flp pilus assembly protein TadD